MEKAGSGEAQLAVIHDDDDDGMLPREGELFVAVAREKGNDNKVRAGSFVSNLQ